MAQQVADSGQIDAGLHEPCGACVAQVVRPEVFDSSPLAGGCEGPFDRLNAFAVFVTEDPGAVRSVFIAIAGSSHN